MSRPGLRAAVFRIAGVLAGLAVPPVLAAGPFQPATEPAVAAPETVGLSWRFTVMPYVWASGLSGTIRPFTGAPTLSFDQGFSDVLEDLDGAFFLSFGAERGRFVILGDVSQVTSSRDGTLPGGIPAEGQTRQSTLTLAAGYRVLAEPNRAVDIFGGFRHFRLEADVRVLGGALSASPERSFTDPILGARAILALSPRWSTVLYADIGGFGVGTDSTVVASALLNYRLTDRAALSFGYRSMWLDYDDGGTLADVTIGGPIFGVSYRF